MADETTQFVHPQTGEVLVASSPAAAPASDSIVTKVEDAAVDAAKATIVADVKDEETKVVGDVKAKVSEVKDEVKTVEVTVKADVESFGEKLEGEAEKVIHEVEDEAKKIAAKVTGLFHKGESEPATATEVVVTPAPEVAAA